MRQKVEAAFLKAIPEPNFDITISELTKFINLLSGHVKVVIMPIAPPGYGKSWLIRQIQAELINQQITVVCPDDLRPKDCKTSFKDALDLAHQEAQRLLFQWLASECEVGVLAYDATHVKKEWRGDVLSITKKFPGTVVVGVQILSTTTMGKTRHTRRVRINPGAPQAGMPLNTIDKYNSFLEKEPPVLGEGLNFLFKVINQ